MMRWVVLAGLAVAGCSASPNTLQLGAVAPPGRANAALFREVLSEPPNSGRRSGDDVARAVGASGTELIGARLDRSGADAIAWRVDVALTSPPVLAPGLVLFGQGGQIVALSLEDGRRRWAVPARGAAALAAAASEQHIALLLGNGQARWIALYDRAATRERLRITAEAPLGAPALFGQTLLVPSGRGDVSAIDIPSASEVARLRVGALPVQPLWLGSHLFFGGPPWAEVARDADAYELPRRPLPEPLWRGPLDTALPNAARPVDRTRLYVDPIGSGRFAHDIYMATYGRVAIGLERDDGGLEWVVALPRRVLAAAPVPGGFALCDESGSVRLIGAQTGHVERQWQLARERRRALGEPTLAACALQGGRVALGSSGAETRPDPLLDQIARVLGSSDPALTEAQRFLSRELAARPEPEATQVLIDMVMRRSLDRALQAETEDLLATRRAGQRYMLAALAGDGGRAAKAPPIAPLGEALAALGERQAAPLLARQLNRPAHAPAALARTAVALEALASEAEYDELSVFFSLHRTSADSPDSVSAVVSIGRTLLRIGGQKARTLLQFATRDPLTVPEIKGAIERMLAAPPGSRAAP